MRKKKRKKYVNANAGRNNADKKRQHIPMFLDGSPLADALHGKPKRIATPEEIDAMLEEMKTPKQLLKMKHEARGQSISCGRLSKRKPGER